MQFAHSMSFRFLYHPGQTGTVNWQVDSERTDEFSVYADDENRWLVDATERAALILTGSCH